MRRTPPRLPHAGFTMIELVMALAGCAVILAAIYGVFSRAVHLRDEATARTREARVRTHALSILRNDLLNAYVSGETEGFASELKVSTQSPNGGFPGYAKLTTTTAPEDPNANPPTGEVQLVEYSVINDPAAEGPKSGMLVRGVTRDLLSDVHQAPAEEPLLRGVESMEVAVSVAGSWETSWQFEEDAAELPVAARVRLQPATTDAGNKPAPIELLVPLTARLRAP